MWDCPRALANATEEEATLQQCSGSQSRDLCSVTIVRVSLSRSLIYTILLVIHKKKKKSSLLESRAYIVMHVCLHYSHVISSIPAATTISFLADGSADIARGINAPECVCNIFFLILIYFCPLRGTFF